MLRNYYSLSLFLGGVLLLSSCAKEGPTGPTGPAGPAYTGTISGHVSLYDQYGSKVLLNLDSVKLTLSGTTTAINPDNNGFYSYSSLITGEYSIAASNSGYGATNTNNFQFLSGTLNRDIKLSAIPSFSLSFTYAGPAASLNDSLVINCQPSDPQARNCIIFVGNTPSVGAGEANYLLSYVKAIPANAQKITGIISAQELYNAGFTSGSTAYYAVYSYPVNDQSVYEDQATGKNVYNAVSNPQIDSALVP